MRSRAIPAASIDLAKLGPDSPLRAALAPNPRRRGPRATLREHHEQVKVMEWATENPLRDAALTWLFAVPNGARVSMSVARRLKAEGLKRGVPDLWLPVARGPYHGLVVEMKAGENRPTPDQKAWLVGMEKNGWRTWIAYSAEDAIAVITNYLAGSP